MTKFQILLIIGFICFIVGLIDDLVTHAANFSDFNILGKFCCIGVVLCIAGWIYILITENLRR